MNFAAQIVLIGLIAWGAFYAWRWRRLRHRHDAWSDLAALGLIALRLWLGRHVPLYAMPIAPYDDRLFLRQATSISEGNWLGAYDPLTLAKGPFYSLFWATAHAADLSLINATTFVYAFGAWLLMVALRQQAQAVQWWAQVLVLALVLFCPVLSDTGQFVRAWRQPLWIGLVLVTLAAAIGFAGGRGRRAAALWAALLGAAGGAAWITREEAVWLAPAVGGLLAYGIGVAWRAGERGGGLVARLVPLALAPLIVGAVALMNARHYGFWGIVEYRDPHFLKAYGALASVPPHDPVRRIPVTRAARERLYAVSPAMRELKPHLEGGIGAAFMAVTEENTGIPRAEGEIAGGWFMWALRDAVRDAGHAGSYEQARSFYDRLASEVHAAVARGELTARKPSASMRPPLEWDLHGPRARVALGRGIEVVLGYPVMPRPVPSVGSGEDLQWMMRMTGDSVASVDPAIAARQGDTRRVAIWTWLISQYRRIVSPVAVLAAIMSVGWTIWTAWRRRLAFPAAAGVAGVIAVGANVAVVALVDATSWSAVHLGYLGPSVALALVPLTAVVSACGTMRHPRRAADPANVKRQRPTTASR